MMTTAVTDSPQRSKRQKTEEAAEDDAPDASSYVHSNPRDEWARQMRLKFTKSYKPEMLLPSGDIDPSYFKPTRIVHKEKKWGDNERTQLIKGIAEHGIGNWAPIVKSYLPDWTPLDLRIKTQRVMGRQSLEAYKGWKGGEAEVEAEYEKNKRIGMECNAWKGGVLVVDSDEVRAKAEALGY